MFPPMKALCLATLTALCIARFATVAESAEHDVSRVLKWPDGKKACFMLGFDDSCKSQLDHAIPLLEKHKMVGTFYLVTGNGVWKGTKPKWEAAAKSPYVSVANHTFTHDGTEDPADLDEELAKCNEVLYQLHPEWKKPRLIGFARPGGVPWTVTAEQQAAALKNHDLVDRPPFHGPPFHFNSPEQMTGVVDAALAKGEMGHLDFHGVGGDWHVTPVDWFSGLLDKLDTHREELWITDVVSWHQYVTERDRSKIAIVQSDAKTIRLQLTSDLDRALYNLPLTLETKVPADWKTCAVTQGENHLKVATQDGCVRHAAVPGGGEIRIEPVR